MEKIIKISLEIVATVLTTLFLSSCSKTESPSPHQGTIAGTSGSLARFAIASDHLYTVSGSDMSLYNVSEAANPVFENTIPLEGGIETIFSSNNTLFIGTRNGIQIYDIHEPNKPLILSRYQHATSCDPVVANGKYAFVTLNSSTSCTGGSNQLDIINIQTLNSPSLVKSYPMTRPKGLAIDGNYLFVCDEGIKFYDATDVTDLKLKKYVSIKATDVIANNGILMITGDDGLYQYDYSKGDLTFLSKIPTT